MVKVSGTSGSPHLPPKKRVDPSRNLVEGSEQANSLRGKMQVPSPESVHKRIRASSKEIPPHARKIQTVWIKCMHTAGKKKD